jgi:hypothetical protein
MAMTFWQQWQLTGSGKTGYSIMLILVKYAISEEETLALIMTRIPIGCLSYKSSSGSYSSLRFRAG